MMEMILTNAIIVLFALVLIAWSMSEMMRMRAAGPIMTALYGLGTVMALVMVVAYEWREGVQSASTILALMLLALTVVSLYVHIRMKSTMVAPISALVVVLMQMSHNMGVFPDLSECLPLLEKVSQPWINASIVLGALGTGMAAACAIVGIVMVVRQKQANAITPDRVLAITAKMPKMLSHLAWWALAFLSFSLGGYFMWCHTLFGHFYFWQPYFAMVSLAWLAIFIGKDMLFTKE